MPFPSYAPDNSLYGYGTLTPRRQQERGGNYTVGGDQGSGRLGQMQSSMDGITDRGRTRNTDVTPPGLPENPGAPEPPGPQSVGGAKTPGQIINELNGQGSRAPTSAEVQQNPGLWAGTSFDPNLTRWGSQGPPPTGGATSMPQGSEVVPGYGAMYTGSNGPLDTTRFTPAPAPSNAAPAGSMPTFNPNVQTAPSGATYGQRDPNEDYDTWRRRTYGLDRFPELQFLSMGNQNTGGYTLDSPQGRAWFRSQYGRDPYTEAQLRTMDIPSGVLPVR